MKKTIHSIAFSLMLQAISSSVSAEVNSTDNQQIEATNAQRLPDTLQVTGYSLQEEATSTQSPVTMSAITASDYCDFLNHVAIESDPDHLYNQAMASDPTIGSIVRVGAPGRWHYEVIAGQENCPVKYVSNLSQASYADRLQAEISCADRLKAKGYRLQEEANDDYLSCNSDTFEVEVPSTMLTLVSSSFPTSTSNFDSYITDISAAVGLLGLVALGHEFVTLEDFRTAATTHPAEQRLIITGKGENATIQPKDSVGNRAENLDTADVLIATLQPEYPGVDVQETVDEILPKTSGFIKSRPDLTPAKLQKILCRLDQAISIARPTLIHDSNNDDAPSLDESVHSCASSRSTASGMTTASEQGEYDLHDHLQLEHFIGAALAYPMDKIMIDAGDSEMPMRKKHSFINSFGSQAQKENKLSTLAFKGALRKKYGRDKVQKLLPGRKATYFESLSSPDIFKYINAIEDRITKEIIKPGQRSDLSVLEENLPRKEVFSEEAQKFAKNYDDIITKKQTSNPSIARRGIKLLRDSAKKVDGFQIVGTSVGPLITLPVEMIGVTYDYVTSLPLKNVEKICEATKEDYAKVKNKIDMLKERENIRINQQNPSSPQGGIDDQDETHQDDGNRPGGIASRSQLSHQHAWNKAIKFSKEADAAYPHANKENTSDAWLDCKAKYEEAQKLWRKAAEAKQIALLHETNAEKSDKLTDDMNKAMSKSKDYRKKANDAELAWRYIHLRTEDPLEKKESDQRQKHLEYSLRADQAEESGISPSSRSLREASKAAATALDYFSKAIKEKNAGDPKNAQKLEEVGDEHQAAAKIFEKAAEAHEKGNTEVGVGRDHHANILLNNAQESIRRLTILK